MGRHVVPGDHAVAVEEEQILAAGQSGRRVADTGQPDLIPIACGECREAMALYQHVIEKYPNDLWPVAEHGSKPGVSMNTKPFRVTGSA